MKLLVIDTETTGLPQRNASIYKTEQWPYVVQLSFILFDTDSLNIIYKFNEYINPPKNITISQDSFNIHKISNEFVNENGINILDALTTLNTVLIISDLIVGHNISFDKQILMVEFIRNNIKSNLTEKNYFCTMKKYVNYCKIPKPSYPSKFKYPKLSELYKTIFLMEPDDLHNSYNDILICLRCYYFIEYDENDLLLTSNDFIDEFNKYFNSSLQLISLYN